MFNLISFIILTSGLTLALCRDEPVVNTPLGFILGTFNTSRKNVEFYSFRGIRYAEAPVKDFRFKPPVPVKPWKDVFNATQDGPLCDQAFIGNVVEDCLRLNVYTHHIDSDTSRPVLVFIHSGEFEEGSGRSIWLGPEYLMDHDIVLVTFNYRLGVLGFFSTGDEHAPGNYGMKDQVEVLRWVQNNIHAFGGDPNKVTIAGQDAGAASVIYHLISPLSKGLFHRAIAMSSSALNNWTITRNPKPIAVEAAALVSDWNCPTDGSQKTVECLRRMPADDISFVIVHLHRIFYKKGELGTPLLTPVIECGNNESEKFLSKDPLELLKEGNFADVPLMIGTTRDERSYKARFVLHSEERVSNLSADWNHIAPMIFQYEPSDEISKKLREFYLGSPDQPLTWNVSKGLERLYSDSLSIFGVVRTAKLISDKNDQPVYLYQFNYQKKIPTYEDIYHTNLIVHDEDATLLFKAKGLSPIDDSKEDAQCADKLITLWTNFMETGNPTPEPSALLDNVIWKPFKTDEPSYLDINETLRSVKGLYYEDRMSFWETLFPL